MGNEYTRWFKILLDIVDKKLDKALAKCPNCNQSAMDYQYIGDKETNIGYMLFWCNKCLNGIHVSRVVIPKDEYTVDFKDNSNIPKFNLIL